MVCFPGLSPAVGPVTPRADARHDRNVHVRFRYRAGAPLPARNISACHQCVPQPSNNREPLGSIRKEHGREVEAKQSRQMVAATRRCIRKRDGLRER